MFGLNGYVVDDNGIDLALVKEIKEVRRGRISEYVSLNRMPATSMAGRSGMSRAMWPCRLQRRTS